MNKTLMALALACAFGLPHASYAADDQALIQLQNEIRQMKQEYESRLQQLEQRLAKAESNEKAAREQAAATPPAPQPAPQAAAAGQNVFNPAVALILGGTYAHLSEDPARYRLQGFMPGGSDVGPGKRSFSLGESELTLSANIDPQFAGNLTFSLGADNSVSVEEAFFRTLTMPAGLTLKAGRFLSSVGYLNSQHAHAWDFVDAPLAYQAFFGGQYKPDGVQLKWLAPTDRFFEVGAEAGNGIAYPGNDRNRNGFGATTLFAHVGDDIGDSGSWRAGLSWLHTGSADRSFSDAGVTNSFSGGSNIWIADAIYKWAPHGNPVQTNFKLQGEYFRRREDGTLAGGGATGAFASTQSGWYLQGVYQFRPMWRTGLRYDRLQSGTPEFGGLDPASFPQLAAYDPRRVSWMLDYSPSEFSRFRLQLARDRSRPGVTDNQILLQYIMSLGAHGAHTF